MARARRATAAALVASALIAIAWTASVHEQPSPSILAQTTTTVAVRSAPAGTTSQAWITVVGVVSAALLSFAGGTLAAKSQLKGVLASAESNYGAALRSGQAQVDAALASARAQQEIIHEQLRREDAARLTARLDHLADHRRERHEETILALQDALEELDVVLSGLARTRVEQKRAKKGWAAPREWNDRLDRAYAEAYKLLQRLPRGEQLESQEDEAWKRVKWPIDELREAVVKSTTPATQEDRLARFRAGIVVAQDELGKALDGLDHELLAALIEPGRGRGRR